MLLRRIRGWEIAENEAAPEEAFLDRRRFLAVGASMIAGGALGCLPRKPSPSPASTEADPSMGRYPATRNSRYVLDRPVTEEGWVTAYNNFYEFSSDKRLTREAQALRIRPWTITVDGLVEKPFTVDIDTLLRKMPLEERLYRHRCVETWAIAVPWSGFPLEAFV